MHPANSPNIIPFPTRKRSFLCDGPLMTAPERRSAMVIHMSAALIEHQAYGDVTDAMRCLRWCAYSVLDAALLHAEAMEWARQCVTFAAEVGNV